MSVLYRVFGSTDLIPLTINPAATATPTVTLYTDAGRTVPYGGAARVLTGSGTSWSYSIADLPVGTYYLHEQATTTGGTVSSDADSLIVLPGTIGSGSSVTVTDIRTALNKSLTVDDVEIQQMIDDAEAEYTEYVGPISGEVTEKVNGGSDRLVLRSPFVLALTAAAYTDGSALNLTDLDLDTATGIVYWNPGTVGWFTSGTRNVQLTYTVASLPENHRGTIIADVAGYFEATQLGPLGPDDTGYSNAYTATPVVRFPRIRALAPPRVG